MAEPRGHGQGPEGQRGRRRVDGAVHDPRGAPGWRVLARTWTGVVLISFSAVYVRLADVEAARSALLRGAYALPAFLLLLAWRRAAGRSARLHPVAVAAGVCLGIDLVTWHASIGIIGAGLGTVLPNLQVVIVGIIGVAWLGERPARSFWGALPLVILGVWLLAAAGESVVADGSPVLGVGFGLVTAVAYSFFLVLVRFARMRGASAPEAMASATLGATLVMGVAAAWEGVLGPAPTLESNLWLLALALGSQFGGWLLLSSSIDRLPAAMTSVALLLQPVLALLWGALLLAEPLGPVQLGGAAVVLAGVAIAHRATAAVGPATERGASAPAAAD